ncbi:MAG TPA: aminotransferase class V-fold PLP-dependent enzyme [Anaerolineales bacterium]|nr:aminotransferase class V-fold PLP-dependent enzyme [Anaerolineales bacterium]
MEHDSDISEFASLFNGIDIEVPTLNGGFRRYINLDNAASTPPLNSVKKTVNEFMNYYSSVHRGTGYKSQLSTHAYEFSRDTVLNFLGADPQFHTCIFGKNTTEAINKLSRRYPFTDQRNIVLASGMEHHSNDLPWRSAAKVVHIRLSGEGKLDETHFDEMLEKYSNQVALVAITGASNVTGFINPYYRLAEKAHSVGAKIALDCAQLAPHRKIDMLPIEDPAHIDYVTISAHKLYAPFGTGALVGLKETFEEGDPDVTGGGTVDIVTLDDVVWTIPPERDEAGSPNTIGAVALAAAIHQLEKIGMEAVADHEAKLTAYTLERLNQIEGISIYGDNNPDRAAERLGVIPFNLQDHSHFLVAAILGHEFGIGIRNGCFCAHPYVLHLLNITQEKSREVRQNIISGDRSDMPGFLRASFGLYNSFNEVDTLIDGLSQIQSDNFEGEYLQDRASGDYSPQGWEPDFEHYFSIPDLID